ncbi:TonB-dependent receptor [Chitinophaga polysaccharea]|uniref:TonB-dependent receptor n=1 Tax=Chitinophaga polysaccharea TaxID=1293035 RepID=UPI00115843E1|nr:TonB-dependent receptor [Chitinophaga polysaccharea]
MKTYFTLQLLLILSVFSYARIPEGPDDAGIVKGRVLTSDNQPASQVTILLGDKQKGAITNEQGEFIIRKVKPGNYTIRVSLVGHEPLLQNIQVEANKTTILELRLKASDKELQAITVTGSGNKFAKRESNYIARLPLKNLENPQVYNVISKDLMQEQVTVDYKSALRNVPGAAVGFGGVNNGITYMILRGFWVISQIRNGMAAMQSGGIDPVNVERIEVLKGPSGTLFGSSLISFGGFSNLVTKKPFDTFRGEVNYTAGSWNLNRLTADINTPLNDDKSALLRLNAAVHTENSFQSYGASRSLALAPSFSYKVNDRLTLSLDAEIYKVDRSAQPAYSYDFKKISFRKISDLALDYKQSIGTSDPIVQQGNLNVFVQADYKMSDQWTSSTQYAMGQANFDNINYLWPAEILSDSTIKRNFAASRGSVNNSIQFQQNFTGDFKIGRLRNRMVAGAEVYYLANKAMSYGTLLYDTVNVRRSIKPMSLARMNDMVAAVGSANQTVATQYRYSAYVSDMLNFTDQLMLMLSLRLDRFENKGTSTNGAKAPAAGIYGQTSVSPKLGIVYQPVKDKVSLFANYMNGFQNMAPVTQPDQTALVLKPQYGNQWEAGTKVDIVKHKLSGTLSYYHISVNNAVRANPDNPTFSIQDGSQLSKGFEADIIANPAAGLNIIAGYGYNKFTYTKANKGVEGTSNGLPAHMANLWVSYKFPQQILNGFGIGIGGNYVSDTYPENESNLLTIPAYTRLDATVFYDYPKFRIGVKINNITNAQYWGINNDPQSPRNIAGSISYKF